MHVVTSPLTKINKHPLHETPAYAMNGERHKMLDRETNKSKTCEDEKDRQAQNGVFKVSFVFVFIRIWRIGPAAAPSAALGFSASP